jgi:SAM-dependent methyltransferase
MMNPAEFANIANSEEHFWWYRGMRRIMFRLLDPLSGGISRVLEAGCGTGHFSKVLGERYGWTLYPMDLGREGLEFARAYGLRRLVQADIRALPYRDGAFDALMSMDVVVHLPRGQEDVPVAEAVRVVRPGGLIAFRVSALDILRSRHSIFAHERQRFTRGRLVELAERHGLRVLRCTYANSLLLPVAVAKFRLWEPLFAPEPASGVTLVAPWIDRLLGVPLEIESRWIGAGLGFPAGQSLILIALRE